MLIVLRLDQEVALVSVPPFSRAYCSDCVLSSLLIIDTSFSVEWGESRISILSLLPTGHRAVSLVGHSRRSRPTGL